MTNPANWTRCRHVRESPGSMVTWWLISRTKHSRQSAERICAVLMNRLREKKIEKSKPKVREKNDSLYGTEY